VFLLVFSTNPKNIKKNEGTSIFFNQCSQEHGNGPLVLMRQNRDMNLPLETLFPIKLDKFN